MDEIERVNSVHIFDRIFYLMVIMSMIPWLYYQCKDYGFLVNSESKFMSVLSLAIIIRVYFKDSNYIEYVFSNVIKYRFIHIALILFIPSVGAWVSAKFIKEKSQSHGVDVLRK
ncbi:hypothetical protein [Vibrio rarus]|uniref:hypothetical protein n=1 Tax=Vibrio rarus TaxID=413403 RepID=UPI0021C487D2|nr:hypothetical protein [Vibrio rarus]